MSAASDRAKALLAKYRGKSLSRMSEHDRKEWAALTRYFEAMSAKLRRRNPRKFDRCVMEVKRRRGARNAYAVCNAALRRKNPRRISAKPIPAGILPAIVHTARVVYFYPDKSPFGDDVLVGNAKPMPSGIECKVLHGTQFTGGDFKVLVSARLGGDWYAWLMPSEMVEGASIREALAGTRKRRKNPRFKRSSASVTARHGGALTYALVAKSASGRTLTYTTARKFATRGSPHLFRSLGTLRTVAKFMRLKYPVLKNYSFYAAEA